MEHFKIEGFKVVWAGWVLLCQEPDGSWTTAHSVTHDCRTGRYWVESFCTPDDARRSFKERTF